MNRLNISALICIAMFAGCDRLAEVKSDDEQWLLRIDQKMAEGDLDAALAESQKYIDKYPKSSRGWGSRGWLYLQGDDVTKAHECFDKSLSINPPWDNAYVGKGAAYRKEGNNARARECYLLAISLVPDNAEAYGSLLVIELLEGDYKKAVEQGEKAWSLRRDLATIPANLSVAYHYLGDHSQRDEYYKHAERLGYRSLEKLQDIYTGKTDIR